MFDISVRNEIFDRIIAPWATQNLLLFSKIYSCLLHESPMGEFDCESEKTTARKTKLPSRLTWDYVHHQEEAKPEFH